MTVLQTAYNTTACRDFQMGKTAAAIHVAFAHGQLTALENSNGVYLIQGGASVIDSVPAFAHPLVIEKDHKQVLIMDARQYGKWDPVQYKFVVKAEVEYALAVHRARLTAIWMKESPSIIRDISPVPMGVYASWISESVAKRFALDPRQQFNLAILAAVFYCSQFLEGAEREGTDMRMVNQITRALKASAQDVLAVVEKAPYVASVEHFCHMAEEVTGSVRMQELKVGVLFAIMGGTWFGTNAREIACVAIEHPPTWIAILMQAISERSYKNSGIAKISERSAFRDSGQVMLRAVLNLEASIEH